MNLYNLRLEISNPFDSWDYFKNLGCAHGVFGKHTAWELEHTYYSPLLLDVETKWSFKTDHAGLSIGIGLLGYGISFRIYDTRHWNYETNSWETYEHIETDS